MTFKCCENCIIDMICTTPCEKFEVEHLQLYDLSDFNKCMRLMKKYKNKSFNLENKISIKVVFDSIAIYKNGNLHRDDGPAVIYSNGYKSWWKNNKLQRDDGPAFISANGYKEWFENGVKIK